MGRLNMGRNSTTRLGCVKNRIRISTGLSKMEEDHRKSNLKNGRRLTINEEKIDENQWGLFCEMSI